MAEGRFAPIRSNAVGILSCGQKMIIMLRLVLCPQDNQPKASQPRISILGQALFTPRLCFNSMARQTQKQSREDFHCPLCKRSGDYLSPSKHHLVPKSRDGEVTVEICSDCHRQIHALFTLVELEREFSSIDALKTSRPMQKWIHWAAKQGGGRVAVRTSHAKRNSYQKAKIYGAV